MKNKTENKTEHISKILKKIIHGIEDLYMLNKKYGEKNGKRIK